VWALLTPAHHIFAKPYPYPDFKFTWGLSVLDLLAALVIVVALQPGSYLYKIFSLRPMRWMGRITYGAYMFHDIPHTLYSHLGFVISPKHAGTATDSIALGSTILLAWASSRFFESQFINLKERWTRRVAVKPTVTTAA
jgi:peptidoglycan/LPS O-acetylase OafA/YrhL